MPRIEAIWSRLLGIGAIAPSDSFFDLGGHSILAVQAHRDVRAALGADRLSITDVFRFPTLKALAQRVDELNGVVASTEPASSAPADGRAAAMARRRDLRARRMGQT